MLPAHRPQYTPHSPRSRIKNMQNSSRKIIYTRPSYADSTLKSKAIVFPIGSLDLSQ